VRVAPFAGQLEAGGQVAHGLTQISGQQPEHPSQRQGVDLDWADPGRIGIQVTQFGQGLVRAGRLASADHDQGAGLAGSCRVEAAGAQCPPAEGLHLLSVPEQRVRAG
jgi:hypothetical protein